MSRGWKVYEGIRKESQRSETPTGVRTASSGLSRRLDVAEGRVSEQEGMSVNLPKSKAKRAKIENTQHPRALGPLQKYP